MLWYLRENVTARPPFPLPRRPSLLSLDRCCGRVFFRPSFIRLLALREPGAVGVLPRRSSRRRFVCLLGAPRGGEFLSLSLYLSMYLSLFLFTWVIRRDVIGLKSICALEGYTCRQRAKLEQTRGKMEIFQLDSI